MKINWMKRSARVELRNLVYRKINDYVAIDSPYYESLLRKGYKLIEESGLVICNLFLRCWKWPWQQWEVLMLWITEKIYESARPGSHFLFLLNTGCKEVKKYNWVENDQEVRVMVKRFWKFTWKRWDNGGRW